MSMSYLTSISEQQSQSRVQNLPDSVRSAVSPRRSGKSPRQWPPPAMPTTNRYWQIDPADALKKEKVNYGEDLVALIKEVEQSKEKEPKVKKEPKKGTRGARRASNISKEQVQQAFEEQRKRTERKEIKKLEKEIKPKPELKVEVPVEPLVVPTSKPLEEPCPEALPPPKINDGIHWTVIHSPVLRSPSPAKVTSEAAIPESNGVVKPIPSYASQPIGISKTSTPQPFRPGSQVERPHYSSVGLKDVHAPVPLPRSPQHSPQPVQSYIVRSSDANVTTSTNLQTTVTRQYTENDNKSQFLQQPHPDTIDSSTSPIPTIRLNRHTKPEPSTPLSVPTVSINDIATSPIKITEPSRPWRASVSNSATSPIKIHESRVQPVDESRGLHRHEEKAQIETSTIKIHEPSSPPPSVHKFGAVNTRAAPAPVQFMQTPRIAVKIHEPTGPSPTPPSTPSHPIKRDPKHFKKVDFSKTSPTVIPEWKDSADIVDESDILTECSREDDSISFLKAATYDGDESEMIDNNIDNKSDITSTFDIEEEEVDVVQDRERIRVVGRKGGEGGEAEKQWRQRAMELLDDDAQTERDLRIVAALNERLQGKLLETI